MTKTITAVNTNLAFSTLYTAVNTVIQVLANEIVTANSAAGGGATTVGNGFVVGIFGANTIVAPLLVGGNVISTNVVYMGANLNVNTNVLLSGIITVNSTYVNVGANVSINSSTVWLGNSTQNVTSNSVSYSLITATSNATINASGYYYNAFPLQVGFQINTTTTGTSAQAVDNWLIATYRSAEYILSVTDNAANNYEVTKVNVIQSGGAAFHTEFGTVLSNSSMGVFGVTTNSTAVILQWTPTSANTTVKGIRFSVPV